MQPKPYSRVRHTFPAITLYLEDIEAIVEAGCSQGFTCQFSDENHIYRDLTEVQEQKGVTLRDIEISFFVYVMKEP